MNAGEEIVLSESWVSVPHFLKGILTTLSQSNGGCKYDYATVPFLAEVLKMKYLKPLNLFQELLKSNEIKRSRLLGLDVGDKYVGLAVSDVDNKIASPLSVLLRKKTNIDSMAADFESLISELHLTGFVVGYPFDRQKSSPGAVQVKVFIDDLCKTGKFEELKYTFWDECFTSKNVDFLLKPLNLRPVQSKTILDKFAAVGILQGYLDFANRNPSLKSTG
ncbi:Polynucleotidyl transferase [Forsythia ovata]|uniref:Polynucleotidyl transferase n=1 Tax=Forsythia ovata TaxID=205694 RepID=A0ABD1W1Z7_9LAMI